MRRFISFSALVLMAAFSFVLTGCEDRNEVTPPAPEQHLVGFAELVQAYKDGRVFESAEHTSDGCVLNFTEGYSFSVPASSFTVHDCTASVPADVAASDGWWSINGTVYGIKVEPAVSDEDSRPVYVYFDSKTLHAHLSNRNVLDFNSVVLEDEKQNQEEIARRQNIPVVYIDTKEGAPILDKKNYVDGTITIQDPEHLYSDVTEFSAEMGIRGRGNSTWSFPKKPWKVKLKEKASLLGMPADKEWCLLANYADRTLVRNIVAMRLSEMCGFSWTPRMHSVEVYLNDEYQGVYTLCEHKKVSSSRVDIDVDAGEYYLEIEEQQDADVCWWTSMGVPMMFSEPELPTDEQITYIKDWFNGFEQALRDKNYSESTGYPAYIDVDSFIDNYIVQELTKNVDGNLRKSSFLTKEQGGKLEMYHLWDFDLTLGNCGYFGNDVGNGPENFWVKRDRWYPYLFNDPAFVDRLQNRWDELYPQLQTIPEYIDLQVLYLDKAKDRNFERWSIWESVDWVQFPSLGSYEKEVAYLKEFYTKRLEWLDAAIDRM